MNFHDLACKLGQHLWGEEFPYEGWSRSDSDVDPRAEEAYFKYSECYHCQTPHPKNYAKICELEGHVWRDWEPFTAPEPNPATMRDDISNLLLSQMRMAHGLGKYVTDTPATERRECSRCRQSETNARGHFENTPSTATSHALASSPSAIWIEDRLT